MQIIVLKKESWIKKAVVKDFLTTASDGKIVELLMKNSEKIV